MKEKQTRMFSHSWTCVLTLVGLWLAPAGLLLATLQPSHNLSVYLSKTAFTLGTACAQYKRIMAELQAGARYLAG